MERAKTVEERRQQWKDRYFNKYYNEPARVVVLMKENAMLREELKKYN